MAFKNAVGYGDMFSYTGANVRGDGFEVPRLAGTVLRTAFSELVFGRLFSESRDAFGVGKGGTFTVPIFKDWGSPATVSPLVTGTAISVGTQNVDSIPMSMYEYGTGIGWETLGDWFTSIDVRSQLVNTLGRHIGRMVNWLDYDIVQGGNFSLELIAAGSFSPLLGTNRRRSGVATIFAELGQGAMALAYDSFKKSLVSPVTERGLYGIVGNSRTFRNLKQGSVFQNQYLYSGLQGRNYQILGEAFGFLFLETEELTGNGTTFAFGQGAAGFGFGKLPSLTFYPDFGSDAGRLQVWKTLFYRGQGPIWRDKGTAIITIRSNSDAYTYGSLG